MKSTQRGTVAAALEAARAYRRPSPAVASPKKRPRVNPPPKLAALLRDGAAETSLPGVPDKWLAGVNMLATMPSPAGIEPQRWAAYVATAARLLHQHGPALHAAGWRTLDVFGLHGLAAATYCPGWGLAWLLGAHGDVLDVTADAIGMCRHPGGARMAFRRRVSAAGLVAAWSLRQLRIATIPALRVESFGQYPRADGYPQLPLRGYAEPGPARTWLPQVVCAAAPSRSARPSAAPAADPAPPSGSVLLQLVQPQFGEKRKSLTGCSGSRK